MFHFHGPWAGESQAEGESGINVAVKRTIESRVYRRADRFIALSSAFARILERQYGIAARSHLHRARGVSTRTGTA